MPKIECERRHNISTTYIHETVILSDVVVREAEDNTVEGPRECLNHHWRARKLSRGFRR